MKRVYVAGPFRAANAWEIENNVRRAEDLALEVWRSGAVAICPHTNTRHFHGSLPDKVFIKGTLVMLEACHAMVVVAGWQRSDGTKGEIVFAAAHDIPTFYTIKELQGWLSVNG